MTELNKHEIAIITETVRQTVDTPRPVKVHEALIQGGITLVGIFFLGLVVSGLIWLIVQIWNTIL